MVSDLFIFLLRDSENDLYDRPSIIINMAKGEVGESELKRTISNDTN